MNRRIPMALRIFLAMWMVIPSGLLMGQTTDCGVETLTKATNQYNLGNQQAAKEILVPCLDAFGGVGQKEEGLQLMALINLAQDQLDSARFYINRLLNVNPSFNPSRLKLPLYFMQLFEEERRAKSQNQVSSVSKREEDVRKAPATAMMLNEKTAIDRGYTDLIQMLQDQPGFDISTTSSSVSYSSFYQRGYRSFNNDRTMMLIDGIEFSYLWSNNIFLSRQFPMSAFRQLEIIHGPASTMYGTNAYSGVLNFNTKTPADIIQPGQTVGATGTFSLGTFRTYAADLTLAAEKKDLSFVFSARYFQSDEWGRSQLADWDYKPSTPAYYTDTLAYSISPSEVLSDSLLMAGHPYFTINGDSTTVHLTPAGANAARALDSAGYSMNVNGAPVAYAELSKNLFLHGRASFRFFTVGFDYFNLKEGDVGGYVDKVIAPHPNGTIWGPTDLLMFTRFQRPISERVEFYNLTTWHLSELNQETGSTSPYNYENGSLNYSNLVSGTSPFWKTIYGYQLSTQVRNETRVFWSLGKRWNFLSGAEGRFTFAQGDYITSEVKPAVDSGTVDTIFGGNHYRQMDGGIYSQADFAMSKRLKLVIGARIDFHKLRAVLPFRADFTPRFCAVYTPGDWIFKFIYSESFKAPSNFEKYSTVPGVRDIGNPRLKPELAYNTEFTVGRDFSRFMNLKKSKLVVDANAFLSIYHDVIQTVNVTAGSIDGKVTLQNVNSGQYYITGGQLTAEWSLRKWGSLSFNYTYTSGWEYPHDPNGNPLKEYDAATGDSVFVDWVRIADIAKHKFNLIAVANLPAGFTLCARVNYSGARPVGENTTVPGNVAPGGQIDPFLILNGVLTWRPGSEKIRLQLVCNNVLNQFYYVPGIRNATGSYASRIPQPGRNWMINASFQF